MSRYVAQVFDRCGLYRDVPAVSFSHCVALVGTLAGLYPAKTIMAFNLDNTDVDFDGLTEEERDAVTDSISAGRRAAVEGGVK